MKIYIFEDINGGSSHKNVFLEISVPKQLTKSWKINEEKFTFSCTGFSMYINIYIYIYIYQILNNCDAITKTLVKHLPEDREKNMKLSVVNW